MTNNIPSGAKVLNQKVTRQPKCFSFFFFFFFFFFEVTRGNLNRSLKNYGFLYDAIFLHMYACAQVT